MIAPEHGDDACVCRDRRADRTARCLHDLARDDRRRVVQPCDHRRRHVDQRQLRAWLRPARRQLPPIERADDPRLPRGARCARGSRDRARAGDRARRRGRDQVHYDPRRGRTRRRRMPTASRAASPIRRWSRPAFFASDPNLGRIVCAIGNGGLRDLDRARVSFWLDDVLVVANGGRAASLPRGGRPAGHEAADEIGVRVALGSRQRGGDRLDLRFLARLREHQRGLSKLEAARHPAEHSLASAARARRGGARARRSVAAARRRRSPTGARDRVSLAQARRARVTCRRCTHPHAIRLDDLVAIDEQKRDDRRATRASSSPACRPTTCSSPARAAPGKSSLVKAMLVKYAAKGLRLIEVDKG